MSGRRGRGLTAIVGAVLLAAICPGVALGAITDTRNAKIDGSANGSSSPPGGVLNASLTADVSGGSWSATKVTFSTDPADEQCIDHSNVSGSDRTVTFKVTAPGTPSPAGTGYDATFTPYMNSSCTESPGPSVTLTEGLRVTRPADNPNLHAGCGLNIMLVLDRSGSIGSTAGAEAAVKAATRAFLNSLADTGSAVAINDFSSSANARVPYTVVTSGAGGTIDTVFDPYVDNIYNPSGWTNWEDAFKSVRSANADSAQPNADLVVFITDGDPTAHNTSGGSPVTGLTEGDVVALSRAEAEANLVKGQASHVFALGVGAAVTNKRSANRLTAISGFDQYPQRPFREADFTLVQDFDDLAKAMREIAAELCGAGVTVTKYVDKGDGQFVVDDGWDFTTRVRVPGGFTWVQPENERGRSATATTDELGIAKFQWRPKDVTATSTVRFVRERPRDGYSFVRADCMRDAVRKARRRAFHRTSTPIAKNVKLKPGEHYTCKVYNAINPGTIEIKKEATPESSQAFDFTGSAGLGNFSLVDDGTGASAVHTATGLPPGTYDVSETVPEDWELTGISCTPEDAAAIAPPGATITLAAGASVACTFTDLRTSPPIPPEPPKPSPPGPPEPPPAPPPPTELVVVKKMPRVARVGHRVRFRLSVTNVGSVPARRVQLGDVPAAALQLARLSASRRAKVVRGNAVWSLGTLNPGETRTVTGSVLIQAGTPGRKRNLALATAINANLARDTADTRLVGSGVLSERQAAPPVTG